MTITISPLVAAGGYLATRRAAAGRTVRDVALIVFPAQGAVDAIQRAIHKIEAGTAIAGAGDLAGLRRAYPFDPYIYRQLAEDLPTPVICRVCACSWMDACIERSGRPCAWSAADAELCTRCAQEAAR